MAKSQYDLRLTVLEGGKNQEHTTPKPGSSVLLSELAQDCPLVVHFYSH